MLERVTSNSNYNILEKLKNLPLKHLVCPAYFLLTLSESSCNQISVLNLTHYMRLSSFQSLQFPVLNVIKCTGLTSREENKITKRFFKDAQVNILKADFVDHTGCF